MPHYRFTRILIGLALLLAALAPQPATAAASSSGAAALAAVDPEFSLLKDINPGGSSSVAMATVLGSRIFFYADDGVHGQEPWISDGTSAGTYMLKDINPTGSGVNAQDTMSKPVVWNGRVYFASGAPSDYGSWPNQLWVTDGTPAGTYMVASLGSAHAISYISAGATGVTFNDLDNESYSTNLLWTNGALGNKVLLYQLPGGRLESFQEYKGAVYTGMHKVDLDTRQATVLDPDRSYTMLGIANDLLFMKAQTSSRATQLWQTDGTAQGTQMVAELSPSATEIYNMIFTSSTFYFIDHYYDLSDPNDTQHFLKTSGKDSGVTEINKFLSRHNGLTMLSGTFFFWHSVSNYGNGRWLPWSGNGTPEGSAPMCTTCMHSPLSILNQNFEFATINGKVLYNAADTAAGTELWITDGSDDGTHRLADLNPGYASASPHSLISMNGFIFFVADDGVHGEEPWIYRPGTNRLVARVDKITAEANASVTIDVMSNDTQLDGRPIWLESIDATSAVRSGVTITRDENGTPGYPYDDRITYKSSTVGTDGFSYTIADSTGALTTGRVILSLVRDIPEPPTDLQFTYANGVFPPENSLQYTLVGKITVTDPDSSTFDCKFTTPDLPFVLPVYPSEQNIIHTFYALDYETHPFYTTGVRCTDPTGLYIEKTITIEVANVNEPPVVPDGLSAGTVEDTSQAFLIPWSDPEGNQDEMTVFQAPKHGSASFYGCGTPGCTVNYTPAANYVGEDSFTLKASDKEGLFVTRTVTVTVLPGNDDPPSMTQPPDLLLPKATASYHRALYGIAAGPYETETVTLTAKASDSAALTDLTVNYTYGTECWLDFTFHPEVAETATITLTLDDGVNQVDYTFTVRAADVQPVWLPFIGR